MIVDLLSYTFIMKEVLDVLRDEEKDNIDVVDHLLNNTCVEK